MTVLITEAINTIIIVGAGLAGLSLSLGLANAGYSVALIERQVDFSRTGATLGVQRNGKKALDELYDGITEDLREAGLEIPEVGGTMVAWWNCRDALLKRVEANPSIELHLGCNTKTIVDGNDCVRVTIEKRIAERTEENKGSTSSDSDKTLTLEGLALIGADGVNSCVRDHLKLSKAQWAEILTWRTRLSVSENDNSEEAELLRPFLNIPVAPMGTRLRGPMNYALFNFHDKLPGTMAFTANLNCANIQESVDDVTSPQAFLERFAESPEELQEINAILQFCEKDGLNYAVKLKVVNLPKDDKNGWGGKGRITLIGDAAHGRQSYLYDTLRDSFVPI